MKQLIKKNQKALGVIALILLVVAVTGWQAETFVQPDSLTKLLKWSGLFGIIAIGVGFVIITGGIDLSIGSLIGLSGVLLPILVRTGIFGYPPLPVPAAIGLVLALGALIGLVHGLLITKLKLQPFLVTLCGLFIYRSLARSVAADVTQGFGNDFEQLKSGFVRRVFFGDIDWLPFGVPMPFVILLVIGLVAAVILNKTVYGRHLLALGRNEEAARFSGVNTDRVKIVAYVICSSLAAFGGMLFVLENNSATGSSFGNFYELYAIAGAVLGGCSLRGGEGTIAGVIAGTALVQVSSDATSFLGVPDSWKPAVIGAFILIGVIIDELFRRFGERRRPSG